MFFIFGLVGNFDSDYLLGDILCFLVELCREIVYGGWGMFMVKIVWEILFMGFEILVVYYFVFVIW